MRSFIDKIYAPLVVLAIAGFFIVGFNSPTLPKIPAGVRALIFQPEASVSPAVSTDIDLAKFEGQYIKSKRTGLIYLVYQGNKLPVQFLPAGVAVVDMP